MYAAQQEVVRQAQAAANEAMMAEARAEREVARTAELHAQLLEEEVCVCVSVLCSLLLLLLLL